ncbi:MAG: CRISPR-associated CARF protein Csa3 [Nanoarchaeota archaeon]|nr:CRISPR-associated CARF protein Csa3 [Nanoarchaeota archaeon]
MMVRRVLIATLYGAEPVLMAIARLGVERVVLLIDYNPDKIQQESLEKIKTSLGKAVRIETLKTSNYDIVEIASKCVELIDLKAKDEEIHVNITSGRKTKAIGLLFAAYARHDYVSRISYYPEEQEIASVVYLPKLSFKLSRSQKMILEALEKGKYRSIKDLSKRVKLSTAMLYRAIDELRDDDFVTVDGEIKLTDAGRIARL